MPVFENLNELIKFSTTYAYASKIDAHKYLLGIFERKHDELLRFFLVKKY